jgi:hypothetical protein
LIILQNEECTIDTANALLGLIRPLLIELRLDKQLTPNTSRKSRAEVPSQEPDAEARSSSSGASNRLPAGRQGNVKFPLTQLSRTCSAQNSLISSPPLGDLED